MDFHGLIIIACVFLVSLVSLLVINRVFRGKTFEEVAAEKKLLADRLYGSKSKSQRQVRKVATKKVKDKKQKSKDAKETDGDSQNDSDNVETLSADSSPTHKRDSHVEFLEPTVINDDNKKGVASKPNKAKATKAKSGILINKSEEAPVKEDLVAEPLNNFESNPPKDVLETKKLKDAEKNKQANKDAKKNKQTKKDDTDSESQQTPDSAKLKQTDQKKDSKPADVAQKKDIKVQIEPLKKDTKPQQPQEVVAKKEVKQEEVAVKKEAKPPVEKHSKVNDTQKSQTNKSSKKKKADNHFDVDIDKLDNADVSSLISVLGRAELTRNEIQILIDFLLNKQQDTPHNHSEWSDDIVQKLRKQLAEKEKALQEEQEASAGIQAKLRELRTEINAERTQNNANIKAYTEEIQAKKAELRNLSQELESVNEKLTAERQKYQAKVLELQNSSQDVVAQLNESNNILKTELLEKNDLIREFQLIANASRQAEEEAKHKLNEVAQHNNNRVVELEISLQEATKQIERQMNELEVAKMLEKEKDGNKVEIRNLQNALDSTKAELTLALNDVHTKTQHNEALLKQIDELNQQLRAFEAHRKVELGQIEELNQQLRAFEGHRTAELDVALSSYKKNISELNEQLSHYKVKVNSLVSKEDELMKQIKEEKEKNNELRMKNWKLIDALQKAETLKASSTQYNSLGLQQPDTSKSSVQEQNRIRELFQRLFPESAAALQNLAFSISFDQWIEQLAKHIKQHQQQQQQQNNVVEQISHNNKTKTTANSEYSNNHVDASSNNHHDKNNDNTVNHKGSENDSVPKEVLQQNIQLKAQIAELTSIVTKTENTLRNLEAQARDQEAHWRSVVQSKDEEINILRNLQEQAT